MPTVTSLKYHTHDGHAHDAGDTYEVDEAHVSNLVGQGLVAAPPAPPPPAPKPSQPVEVMTTENSGLVPGRSRKSS